MKILVLFDLEGQVWDPNDVLFRIHIYNILYKYMLPIHTIRNIVLNSSICVALYSNTIMSTFSAIIDLEGKVRGQM